MKTYTTHAHFDAQPLHLARFEGMSESGRKLIIKWILYPFKEAYWISHKLGVIKVQ